MRHLIQDLRYAGRIFGRRPAFTLLAVLTLALGVGVPIAMFAVFNAVLLRPLPYADAARLVVIRADAPDGTARATLADAEIEDLRNATRLFEDVAGLTAVNGDLTTPDHKLPMERVSAASATDNLLPMLGVKPAFGRLLDDRIDSGQGRVLAVVISHELWSRRYRADPEIIGRRVEINNMSVAVVGILPAGFRLHFGNDTGIPPRVDVWFPTGLGQERRYRGHTAIARLAAGITLEQARVELNGLGSRISAAHPAIYGQVPLRLHVEHLQADAARDAIPALSILLCAVLFVLLISSANVAHLLLARAQIRGRELAIRSAVGASRGRLVRQLLTEGAALGVAGGTAGLLLAQWGEVILAWLRPPTLPPVVPAIDARVLMFALGITIASSLLFSLAPALQVFRADVIDTLKTGGRGDAFRSRGLRTVLIVSEVALTVVLLVSAGLMIRSAAALRSVDTGFNDRRVLTMRASMNIREFLPVESRWTFYREAMERLRALPGVQSVGAVRPLPLEGGTGTGTGMFIERFVADGAPDQEIAALSHSTLPGYFTTLGVRVLQGRDFVAADLDAQQSVAIVDEQFAATAWPDHSALGRRIHIRRGGRDLPPVEVIGVVNHVRAITLRGDGQPQVYLPYHRFPLAEMVVTIRTDGDPGRLVDAARREIEALGGKRPVYDVRLMRTYVDDAAAESRFLEMLLGIFAVIALGLAAVGLYGVVAYSTAQRTREIGVRMALGAAPTQILRLIIVDGMRWTGFGLAVGLFAAVGLTRAFETLLFGVTPADPLTLCAVIAVLAGIACLASFLPARRAARLSPSVTLQAE